MSVLTSDGTVDLQIPKTGTSWRFRVFKDLGLTPSVHGTTDAPRHSTELPLDYRRIMSTVRHPVTWLQSRYYMRGWDQDEFLPIINATATHKDFKSFIDCYLERCPGAVTRCFRRYLGKADQVIRFEEMRSGLASMWPQHARYIWAAPPRNQTDYVQRGAEYGAVELQRNRISRILEAEHSIVNEYYS